MATTELTIHATRSRFERDRSHASYNPPPEFRAWDYDDHDSFALTLEIDGVEVSVWVNDDRLDELALLLKDGIDRIALRREKVRLGKTR